MAAAASGHFAKVVLSDLPSVVPLLAANLATNRAALPPITQCAVLPLGLVWDDMPQLRRVAATHGPFDLIVGGDILYREQAPLHLTTLLPHSYDTLISKCN